MMVEDNNKMKDKNIKAETNPINLGTILFGIVIIFVGFYFLALNLDLISEQFQIAIWQLWPILIIIAGLSFIKVRSWLAIILGITIIVALIGIVGAFIIWGQYTTDVHTTESPINVSLDSEANKGELDVKFGAGNMTIASGADNFINGKFESNILDIKTDSQLIDNLQKVKLDLDSRFSFYSGKQKNDLDLRLNNKLPMALYIDSGAASMDFNLNDVNAELVDINTGASDLEIYMGDKAKDAKLNIDAGVSSVSILIPRTVGVDLNIDSGVTAKQIDDFEKLGDSTYRSRNYRDVDKFLNINLDLGVSDLKINWQ